MNLVNSLSATIPWSTDRQIGVKYGEVTALLEFMQFGADPPWKQLSPTVSSLPSLSWSSPSGILSPSKSTPLGIGTFPASPWYELPPSLKVPSKPLAVVPLFLFKFSLLKIKLPNKEPIVV